MLTLFFLIYLKLSSLMIRDHACNLIDIKEKFSHLTFLAYKKDI